MAATKLKRLYVGSETVWGTPIGTAYHLTPVTGMGIMINNEYYQSDELGTLAPSLNTAQVAHSGGVQFDLDGSYEGILVPLNALDTEQNTGAGPYVHAFVLPSTTAGIFTPYTFLLDHGDATVEWKAEGCIATGISISSEQRSVWKISQEYIGQQITRTTGTSIALVPAVEVIRHADTRLYVDVYPGGTVGTTEVLLALRSFTLDIQNGRHLKWFGGDLQAGNYGVGPWTGTLTTRVETTTATLAYIEAGLLAQVPKQIRIAATSGTKIVWIDFTGYLTMEGQTLYDDDDGNVVVDLTWTGHDSTVLSSWCKFTVTNGLAANPAA